MKSLLLTGILSLVSPTLLTAQVLPDARLKMDFSLSAESIAAGDPVTLDISVENEAQYSAVTNAVINIDLPTDTTDISSQGCTLTNPVSLECTLPEFSPGDTANISITANIHSEGNIVLKALLDADNLIGGSIENTELLTVESSTPNLAPVDLALELSSYNTETSIGGSFYIVTTVKNVHETNAAQFPTVEFTLPENYAFHDGDFCTASDNIVTCNVESIGSQSETEFVVELIGMTLSDTATVTANVSSTQPDTASQNNMAELTGSIVTGTVLLCGSSDPLCVTGGNLEEVDNSVTEQTEEPAEQSSIPSEPAPANTAGNSSGGGSLSLAILCLLLALLSRRSAIYTGESSTI